MLLPHKIGGLLFQVVCHIGYTFARLYADKQMDMVLVYLVNLDTEVPVLLLGNFHGGQKVISDRIEYLPTVLGREDYVIPKECLGVVEALILAHTGKYNKILLKLG